MKLVVEFGDGGCTGNLKTNKEPVAWPLTQLPLRPFVLNSASSGSRASQLDWLQSNNNNNHNHHHHALPTHNAPPLAPPRPPRPPPLLPRRRHCSKRNKTPAPDHSRHQLCPRPHLPHRQDLRGPDLQPAKLHRPCPPHRARPPVRLPAMQGIPARVPTVGKELVKEA